VVVTGTLVPVQFAPLESFTVAVTTTALPAARCDWSAGAVTATVSAEHVVAPATHARPASQPIV
jgi:hypothetical protein